METMTKACEVCNGAFLTRSKSPKRERFCGRACYQKYWNERVYAKRRTQLPSQKPCSVCRGLFQPQRGKPGQATCSIACNNARQDARKAKARADVRNLSPRTCRQCGGLFEVTRFGWSIKEYCTNRCARTAWQIRWMRDNPAEHKRRQQRSRFGGNWLPALERAGYRCEKCGVARGLHVHHKDGSGETDSPNHDLENLMVLCAKCHKQLHQIDYRVIDGVVYVTGKIFTHLGVTTVQVLEE